MMTIIAKLAPRALKDPLSSNSLEWTRPYKRRRREEGVGGGRRG